MMTIFQMRIMRMSGIFKKQLLLLLSLLIFSSCMTTTLEPREISQDLQRLSYVNSNPICVNIKGDIDNQLGHQFVVPFIPVGEIVLEGSAKSFIYASLYKVLSLSRFSPKINSNDCKNKLIIYIKDLSLTGHDLFFTRRIVGEINYQIIYTRNDVVLDMKENSIETSYYKTYAFKTELDYVLNKLLDEFSEDVVYMLGQNYL